MSQMIEYVIIIDVALTQAIVGAAITPIFIALAIQKTKRTDD